MKFLNNIDLRQNEIQNFRVQNLATAPVSPVTGQHYFDTVQNTEYVWNGTKWDPFPGFDLKEYVRDEEFEAY